MSLICNTNLPTAIPKQINEDRLCYDESLERQDWPWIGRSKLSLYAKAHHSLGYYSSFPELVIDF